MARTQVILPNELLKEIDAIAGKRTRSEFIADAAERELKRHKRVELGRSLAEALQDADIPGWETDDATLEWVRRMRESPDRVVLDSDLKEDKQADGAKPA
jgi:hypothetical protein